jgi:hypothetical protein
VYDLINGPIPGVFKVTLIQPILSDLYEDLMVCQVFESGLMAHIEKKKLDLSLFGLPLSSSTECLKEAQKSQKYFSDTINSTVEMIKLLNKIINPISDEEKRKSGEDFEGV